MAPAVAGRASYLRRSSFGTLPTLSSLSPRAPPCLGHDGLYEAVSSPVASYENGKMGRWYLAAGPFFFSVVLGSADLPRDPLLKYQNSQH